MVCFSWKVRILRVLTAVLYENAVQQRDNEKFVPKRIKLENPKLKSESGQHCGGELGCKGGFPNTVNCMIISYSAV